MDKGCPLLKQTGGEGMIKAFIEAMDLVDFLFECFVDALAETLNERKQEVS